MKTLVAQSNENIEQKIKTFLLSRTEHQTKIDEIKMQINQLEKEVVPLTERLDKNRNDLQHFLEPLALEIVEQSKTFYHQFAYAKDYKWSRLEYSPEQPLKFKCSQPRQMFYITSETMVEPESIITENPFCSSLSFELTWNYGNLFTLAFIIDEQAIKGDDKYFYVINFNLA